MQCAGGTGADKGVRLAVFQHRQTLDQAGILFVAHSLDGVVVHVDILGAVDNGEWCQVNFVLGGAILDSGFFAQQHQFHAVAKLGRSLRSALQNAQRGIIAAHGIY